MQALVNDITAIVGAYAIGAWIAALVVALNWFFGDRTSLNSYLRLTGWCGVATIVCAILAAST